MTHMEFFHFCLPEYLQTGEVSEGECVLLFDYQKRDPLNYQAGIVEISKQNLDNLLNKVIY